MTNNSNNFDWQQQLQERNKKLKKNNHEGMDIDSNHRNENNSQHNNTNNSNNNNDINDNPFDINELQNKINKLKKQKIEKSKQIQNLQNDVNKIDTELDKLSHQLHQINNNNSNSNHKDKREQIVLSDDDSEDDVQMSQTGINYDEELAKQLQSQFEREDREFEEEQQQIQRENLYRRQEQQRQNHIRQQQQQLEQIQRQRQQQQRSNNNNDFFQIFGMPNMQPTNSSNSWRRNNPDGSIETFFQSSNGNSFRSSHFTSSSSSSRNRNPNNNNNNNNNQNRSRNNNQPNRNNNNNNNSNFHNMNDDNIFNMNGEFIMPSMLSNNNHLHFDMSPFPDLQLLAGGGFHGMSVLGRDIDNMTYEELLREFPQPPRGANQQDIERLPTDTFHEKKNTSNNNNNNNNVSNKNDGNNNNSVDDENSKCCICLDKFKDGDEIRRLPCLHIFHTQEIDQWLRRNHVCPICRTPVDDR